MTEKASVPLERRYALAVAEFRLARALLAAHDLRLNRTGFGNHPDIIDLRHATACPDLSGSLQDDIGAVR